MANCCNYAMTAVSKDKASLERLMDIMAYKDKEFYLYRVQDAGLSGKPRKAHKTSDLWVATITGNVAWSVSPWAHDVPNPNEKMETGASYTNLLEVCKALNVAVEIWADEIGMEFQQHIVIDNLGNLSLDETEDWDGNEDSGFRNYMEWKFPEDLYVR